MTEIKDRSYRPKKIEIVQVLRGLAAVAVMGYHLKTVILPEDPFYNEINYLFNSGPAGVSLFFVISGFIMVLVTSGKETGIRFSLEFFLRRMIRIWPVYLFVSCIYYLVIFRFNLVPEALEKLFFSLIFLPVSHEEPPFLGYAFLPVGWSLNYEVYFYFVFAVSLAVKRYRWWVFFFVFLVTLFVVPLLFGQLTFKADAVQPYSSNYLQLVTNPIIWNFAYGILIGLIFTKSDRSRGVFLWLQNPVVTFFGVFLCVWQVLSGFYGGLGPFQWGLGTALLFFLLIFSEESKFKNYPRWAVYLGDISYSIYLWHLPVLALVNFVFDRLLGFPLYSTGISAFLLSVGLTIFISHLSYHYLERKAGSYIEKVIFRRS